MNSFLSLVSIENTKIWKRLSSKVLLILMAVIILGLMGFSKYIEVRTTNEKAKTSESQTVDWKKDTQEQVIALQAQIKAAKSNDIQLGIYKRSLAIAEYRLSHNVAPAKTTSFWQNVSSAGLGSLIALFLIIVGSTAVAGEFSEGTMKTMISRPYKRHEILSAKLIATILYGLVFVVGTFLFVGLCTGIFFRFDGITNNELMWTGGSVVNIPGFLMALIVYGLEFLQIIVYLVMAFAIAAIFRSRALATGISLFLLLVGSSIAQALALNFNWGKYILFCNTGFSNYITVGTIYPGTSLGFSLIVSAIYTVVFLFLGYFIFQKRDI